MTLEIIESQFELISDSYNDEEFMSMNHAGFISVDFCTGSESKMCIKVDEIAEKVDEIAEFDFIKNQNYQIEFKQLNEIDI